MDKNHVKAGGDGKTYAVWSQGLDNYFAQKYKLALTDFRKVASLYPEHPDAQSYIKESEKRISNGEDKSSIFSNTKVAIAALGVSIVLAFVSIFLLIKLAVKITKHKKALNIQATTV